MKQVLEFTYEVPKQILDLERQLGCALKMLYKNTKRPPNFVMKNVDLAIAQEQWEEDAKKN
jgi:hypothetical protein